MDPCYFIVLLLFAIFGFSAGKDDVIPFDHVSHKTYRCGDSITIEEHKMITVTFNTTHHIVDASCVNERTKTDLKCTIKKSGKEITATFRGSDHDGLWTCSFKNVVHEAVYDEGVRRDLTNFYNCSLRVVIPRLVTLTISPEPPQTATEATTNVHVMHYSKVGEKVSITCKKENETTPLLKSGSLMMKLCLEDRSCSDSPSTNETSIVHQSVLHENMTNAILHCIYTSKLGEEYSATVQFRFVEPPEISEEGRQARSKDPIIIFQGKVGTTKRFVCKNKEKYGTIHWKRCSSDETCTIIRQSSTNELKFNVSLQKDDRNTTAACVYTNYNNIEMETKILLNVIKPPAIYKNNQHLKLYDQTTQDIYVINGVDGETIGIRCSNQETFGYLLWKTCYGGPMSDCYVNIVNEDSYEKVIWDQRTLQLGDNIKFLHCILRTPQGVDIDTTITFVVQKKTPTPSNAYPRPRTHLSMTTTHTPISATSSSSSERPVIQNQAPSTAVIPLPAKTSQVQSEGNPQPDAKLILEIKKDGGFVSTFKKGDTLDFSCVDPNYRNIEIKIISEADGNFTVVTKYRNHNYEGDNRGKLFRGNFVMNFTSPVLKVACWSYDQGVPLALDMAQKSLTRIDDSDPASEATAGDPSDSTIWIALGAVLLIIILVLLSVMAFKKGKREDELIQQAHSEFAHTSNPQESTPPFPRGVKLEQTYLNPVDMQESPYATYRPQGQEDTYATPYVPTNVEEMYSKPTPKNERINMLYSKVLPKSLRRHQNNAGANEELTYAHIDHQNVTDKGYVNINKDKIHEANYATIAQPNQLYANLKADSEICEDNYEIIGQITQDYKLKEAKLNEDNYSNVFASERYVNAKDEALKKTPKDKKDKKSKNK